VYASPRARWECPNPTPNPNLDHTTLVACSGHIATGKAARVVVSTPLASRPVQAAAPRAGCRETVRRSAPRRRRRQCRGRRHCRRTCRHDSGRWFLRVPWTRAAAEPPVSCGLRCAGGSSPSCIVQPVQSYHGHFAFGERSNSTGGRMYLALPAPMRRPKLHEVPDTRR